MTPPPCVHDVPRPDPEDGRWYRCALKSRLDGAYDDDDKRVGAPRSQNYATGRHVG